MPYTQQHARQVEQRVLLLHSQGRSVSFIADEMGAIAIKSGEDGEEVGGGMSLPRSKRNYVNLSRLFSPNIYIRISMFINCFLKNWIRTFSYVRE